MHSVTALVSAAPDACWSLFTDVSLLTSWVPGLKQATIIAGTHALPSEIHFELAGVHSTVTYTLVYTYDKPHGEIRWQPKLGPQHGVSGFARFEREDGATRVTYGLEHGSARSELDDVTRLLDAFVARVHALR